MKTQIHIDGMSCQNCANKVARVLREVPGVSDAEVNLAEKRAEVTTEQAPDTDALIAAVTAKGFHASVPE